MIIKSMEYRNSLVLLLWVLIVFRLNLEKDASEIIDSEISKKSKWLLF